MQEFPQEACSIGYNTCEETLAIVAEVRLNVHRNATLMRKAKQKGTGWIN